MSDVIDDISERNNVFHMRTYKSLVISAKMFFLFFRDHYLEHSLCMVSIF